MSKTLQDYHNEGQTDASNDKYDPPNSVLDGALALFTMPSDTYERMREENKAYDTGHTNASKNR